MWRPGHRVALQAGQIVDAAARRDGASQSHHHPPGVNGDTGRTALPMRVHRLRDMAPPFIPERWQGMGAG
jgi:hypothetical protein